jgi:photosystem II stability/assembly factor-like uncharacterized protein
LANTGATFVAVGKNGAILYSSNYAETWIQQDSGILAPASTYDLYSIYGYGGGTFVAVGDRGTIITSPSGITSSWTIRASGTTNPLRSVTYGNGVYVAVGDSGTLLTSGDAVTWIPITLSSSQNLKGVTYGYVVSALTGVGVPTFVAVGSAGAVFTSIDNGVTWTVPTVSPNTPTQLNAVTFGALAGALAVVADGQFVAVDNAANVFTSPDGLTWTNQNLTPGSPLYAVIHGQLSSGAYAYSAVGAGGLNMQSQ